VEDSVHQFHHPRIKIRTTRFWRSRLQRWYLVRENVEGVVLDSWPKSCWAFFSSSVYALLAVIGWPLRPWVHVGWPSILSIFTKASIHLNCCIPENEVVYIGSKHKMKCERDQEHTLERSHALEPHHMPSKYANTLRVFLLLFLSCSIRTERLNCMTQCDWRRRVPWLHT